MASSDGKRDGCSRRDFIRRVGAGALVLGAGGCLPHADGEWQSCSHVDGGTPPPPATNRVVEVAAAGVVDPEQMEIVAPGRVLDMLRAGLVELTGAADPAAAWAEVLPDRAPGEVVGLKVNTLMAAKVKTSSAVVGAIATSLQQDGGVAAEDIRVWDRTLAELERAGLTREKLGVPVEGTVVSSSDPAGSGYEPEAVCLSDRPIRLSALLTRTIRHLINVPVMKNHYTAGFTGCLKNHYGSFANPGEFHEGCEEHIARLNALPQIAGKNRLFVMDALIGVCRSDTDGYRDCAPGRILLGFDPVAVDRRGLDIRDQMRAAGGLPPGPPAGYLDRATALGLGAASYDLVEIDA